MEPSPENETVPGNEAEPESFKRSLSQRLSEIPCFRTTHLAGMTGCFATWMLTFLFTSKVKFSYHVGIGAYGVAALGAWGVCAYEKSQADESNRRIQEAMRSRELGSLTEEA